MGAASLLAVAAAGCGEGEGALILLFAVISEETGRWTSVL